MAIRNRGNTTGGVVALRDLDGNGTADQTERWGDEGGSGIVLGDGVLYLATNNAVLRYPVAAGSLTPSGPPETIVDGLPSARNHPTKSIALHPDGSVFVGIGSPSNACQTSPRTPGASGRDPCGELVTRAGIWRFATDVLDQNQADGERFSTGVRNAAAIATHPGSGELYAVIHGRDQLRELWPGHFTTTDGTEKPSEEFAHIRQGSDFGWPYCFHDPSNNTKVLAPEYGGDGAEVGRCADMDMPAIGLPAHWPPTRWRFRPAPVSLRLTKTARSSPFTGRGTGRRCRPATTWCGSPSRAMCPQETGLSSRTGSREDRSRHRTRRTTGRRRGSGPGRLGLRQRLAAREDLEDRRGVGDTRGRSPRDHHLGFVMLANGRDQPDQVHGGLTSSTITEIFRWFSVVNCRTKRSCSSPGVRGGVPVGVGVSRVPGRARRRRRCRSRPISGRECSVESVDR